MSKPKFKLIDVFLYNGEQDMTELRYKTLRHHVDEMVAVSCSLTYQGEPNSPPPPCEEEQHGPGLHWVTVDPEPFPEGQKSEWGKEGWAHIEAQHRNLIVEKLPEVVDVDADDIIMVSDVDEILDPSFLPEIVACVNLFGWITVPMRFHGFALDYLLPKENHMLHTAASRFVDMEPQKQRDMRGSVPAIGWGWHLSWMHTMKDREAKAKQFSHGELANLDVEKCYREGFHANGEVLIRLTQTQMQTMTWPKPLFSDDFVIPNEWRSPAFQPGEGEL